MVGYSFASFSHRAGIKSPNYLKLVMDGERNLTSEKAAAFAKGLGLSELEAIYWENLVAYCQAKTPDQRQLFLTRLSRTRLPDGIESTPLIRQIRQEWDYYSNWHHAAIREMVLLKGFDPNPSTIAKQLRGLISVEEAQASLVLLQRLGFLAEDGQGRLVQSQMHVRYSTPGNLANLIVRRFHKATAKLAVDCLQDDSEQAHNERHFNGLTIAVNRKTLPLIKARLGAYLRELNTEFTITADPNAPSPGPDAMPTAEPADQVYHINLQLVPLTHSPAEAKPARQKEQEREV